MVLMEFWLWLWGDEGCGRELDQRREAGEGGKRSIELGRECEREVNSNASLCIA